MIKYTNPHETITVSLRSDLAEFTMSEYEDIARLKIGLDKMEQDLAEIIEERDNPTEETDILVLETQEMQAYKDRDEIIQKILKMFVETDQEYEKILQLEILERFILFHQAELSAPTLDEVRIEVRISGVNDQQIKDLKQERKKLRKNRFKNLKRLMEIRAELSYLKTHKLILMPVAKAIFATKIMTDHARKKLPKLPKTIHEFCVKQGTNPTDFQQTIKKRWEEGTTEERAIFKELQLQWRQYMTETDAQLVLRCREILTHLLIHEGEIEYSVKYAKQRQEALKRLNAAQAQSMLNFISVVLAISNANSLVSTQVLTTELKAQTLPLLQNVRTLRNAMAGKQSYYKS